MGRSTNPLPLERRSPPRRHLALAALPSAHNKGRNMHLLHCTKSKAKNRRSFFVCVCAVIGRESLLPREGSGGKMGEGESGGSGGGSLDSWACTEVSICVLALTDKVPSSLLDCQLKGKRKLGVRQENDSTHFRYSKQQLTSF